MDRRSFIQSLSVAVAASTLPVNAIAAGAVPKMKITDIRSRKIRVIKDLGTVALRSGLGSMSGRGGDEARVTVGGETFIEVMTDQGLSGIGPGVSAGTLARAKHLLVGQDPLLIEQHAYNLFDGGGSGGANVEIALWDLVGKATGQPLWRLWGGEHDALMPYASQHSVGTPEERARMAERVAHDGWRAIKFRTHFETLK